MNNEQVKELSGIALEVKEILENYPNTRDNNWDLILIYRWVKCGMFDDYTQNIWDFVEQLRTINVESLTRAKRKVQELYPELRGEKRKERERRQEIFVEFNRQRKQDLEDFWEAEVEVGEDED